MAGLAPSHAAHVSVQDVEGRRWPTKLTCGPLLRSCFHQGVIVGALGDGLHGVHHFVLVTSSTRLISYTPSLRRGRPDALSPPDDILRLPSSRTSAVVQRRSKGRDGAPPRRSFDPPSVSASCPVSATCTRDSPGRLGLKSLLSPWRGSGIWWGWEAQVVEGTHAAGESAGMMPVGQGSPRRCVDGESSSKTGQSRDRLHR